MSSSSVVKNYHTLKKKLGEHVKNIEKIESRPHKTLQKRISECSYFTNFSKAKKFISYHSKGNNPKVRESAVKIFVSALNVYFDELTDAFKEKYGKIEKWSENKFTIAFDALKTDNRVKYNTEASQKASPKKRKRRKRKKVKNEKASGEKASDEKASSFTVSGTVTDEEETVTYEEETESESEAEDEVIESEAEDDDEDEVVDALLKLKHHRGKRGKRGQPKQRIQRIRQNRKDNIIREEERERIEGDRKKRANELKSKQKREKLTMREFDRLQELQRN